MSSLRLVLGVWVRAGGGGLRGPPRGPTEGFCCAVRVFKRACVGEERRNLACGLARSRVFPPKSVS